MVNLKVIVVLASIIVGTYAYGDPPVDPLEVEDYLGTWKLLRATEFDKGFEFLVITPDSFKICKTEECEDYFIGLGIEQKKDLLLLESTEAGVTTFKMVLGGWKRPNRTILFGTRLHYHQGRIINGLSMVYEKVEIADESPPNKARLSLRWDTQPYAALQFGRPSLRRYAFLRSYFD